MKTKIKSCAYITRDLIEFVELAPLDNNGKGLVMLAWVRAQIYGEIPAFPESSPEAMIYAEVAKREGAGNGR